MDHCALCCWKFEFHENRKVSIELGNMENTGDLDKNSVSGTEAQVREDGRWKSRDSECRRLFHGV